MEVDRIHGNPKGKDKGKGKYGKNPKGKGFKGKESKGFDNKGKKGGGKFGSKGKHNLNSKGKNSFGGAGKSGKGSGASAGITCFNCGKVGHKAEHCWQPKKVRNVEQTADGGSSGGGAPSQQHGGSSANGSVYAGSSSATYVNPNTQQSSSSNSQSVRRVAMGDDPDVYLFDICPSVAIPDASVRMIAGIGLGCSCEEFFIGETGSDGQCSVGDIYSSEVDWSSLNSLSQPEFGRVDFELYEKCSFSSFCTRAFSDTDWSPTSSRSRSYQPQTVRAIVQELETTSIIIDSGSDATVVPIAYENCGCPINEFGTIQDCQGRKIPTAGMREFHFMLQDITGRTIVLKDYGFSF